MKTPSTHDSYTQTVPIKGMHCASCEILISKELQAINGVTSAKARLKTTSATVTSTQPISDEDIAAAVEAAGYEVGIETDVKPLLTGNPRIWKDFLTGIVVVLGVFTLFRILGLDKALNSLANVEGTGIMALIVGLTAGFSTCMALIGGLVLGVASRYAENHPTETALQKFRPHLFFNFGRIISFIVLGGLIGLLGSAFALQGSVLGFLTLIVGFVMLIIGLQLTDLFPRITKGITLPSGIAKKLGLSDKREREYSHKNAFFIGAATFFLPCGFTQAMQLLAVSTGDPIQGAIIMGAFALGTTPGLLGLGGLTSVVKGVFAQRFFRIVGVAVIAMALLNIANGFNLSGVSQFISNVKPLASFSQSDEPPKDSVILNTTYTLKQDIIPSKFEAKVGQKTTLLVDVKDNGQGCMSTIMIIGLDDRPQYLAKGKKIALTFTPTKPGNYQIACAMGITRGWIIVS